MDSNLKVEDKGYFKYYIFILLNSIFGFIFTLYLSNFTIEVLAKKEIVDLKRFESVPSVVIAASIVMLFMLLAIRFKKVFKRFLFSEIFLYIYIGGLTTLINIISWNFLFNAIKTFIVGDNIAWKVAEVLAFILAVMFAFFADKIVVFKSYSFMPHKLFTELGIFVGARILTELINIGIMFFMIDVKEIKPLIGKVVASIVIIVLNYLFSKFIIFKKNNVKSEIESEIKSEVKSEVNNEIENEVKDEDKIEKEN